MSGRDRQDDPLGIYAPVSGRNAKTTRPTSWLSMHEGGDAQVVLLEGGVAIPCPIATADATDNGKRSAGNAGDEK